MVLLRGLMALLVMLGIWSAPAHAAADGAALGKTLKLKALERNGIQGPLEIAMIATEGRGQMSGYGEVLGEGGAEAVAEWIWQQAQNEWSSPDS